MKGRAIALLIVMAVSGFGQTARAQKPAVGIGIATFASVPTDEQLDRLRQLGIDTEGLKRLPLAIVRGTGPGFNRAVAEGAARAIYPDETMLLASAEANRAMAVDRLHELGLTGEGVQIAVVDTGIDATHPDLIGQVTHNVKIVGSEYVPAAGPPPVIVGAVDMGPGSNTDIGGHGTVVAGVIGADGTSSPSLIGVAPDADLIGYSTGSSAGLVEHRILAAYDHILDNPALGIDVVNNSFASSIFRMFDPGDPISIATRALADAGIVVVFAAGNWGDGDTEMTLSNYAVAPWVIGVAAASRTGARAWYSSNGLSVDNALASEPVDGHAAFEGDRAGIYHPSVTAPGDVTTTCSIGSGTFNSQVCIPGGSVESSGTSLATPAVSGVAALLLQAEPGLSPDQIRRTLEATATPTADRAPFWQAGYGSVDAGAALELVRSPDFEERLALRHAEATRAAMDARAWKVARSEMWSWDPAVVSRDGDPERYAFTFAVPEEADAVRVAFARPDSVLAHLYTISVLDPDGLEAGRLSIVGERVAHLTIDRRAPARSSGTWTIQVSADRSVNDEPDWYKATLHAAAVIAQTPQVPPLDRFIADGTSTWFFAPDPDRVTGVRTDSGCEVEPGEALGGLSPAPQVDAVCHAGMTGQTTSYLVGRPSTFTSDPFAATTTFGLEAGLVLSVDDATRLGTWSYWVDYRLSSVAPGGEETPLGEGEIAEFTHTDTRIEIAFTIPVMQVPEGHRLRLRLFYLNQAILTPALLLFGGPDHGDAGLSLTVGHLERTV